MKKLEVELSSSMDNINIKLLGSTCTVNLLAFGAGNAYSWSSVVITDLRSTNPIRNPLGRPVTPFEESWIASLISLGAVCGAFCSGFLSQKFGRKLTLLMFAVPMFISQVILAFASVPVEFYVARFMVGLGIGCACTIVPIYVGEIAETEIRGLLGCFIGVLTSCGHLFVYIVGPLVNIRTLSFLLMVPIGLFIIIFGLFVPESPYYYIVIENDAAAEMSLNKLRKVGCNQKELAVIKETVNESRDTKVKLSNLLQSKRFRKGITITMILMVFQQCMGISIILSYMEQIFIAAGSTLSSYTSTIIVALIHTSTVILSSCLADKWGRKTLLALSSAGNTIPLFSLGLYFYLKNSGEDVSALWWLPVASLVVFIFTFNLAFSTLPWALIGELFSSKTKSLASSITTLTCYTLAFLTTLIFPTLEELLGLHVLFWIFAGCAISALVFIISYIPETKGRTFQEILKILDK